MGLLCGTVIIFFRPVRCLELWTNMPISVKIGEGDAVGKNTIGEDERATILVVDDVPQNLELMKTILLVAGYNVVTASQGEEALQRVQEEPPESSAA